MTQERPRITVAAVIERDGRYLLVEERSGEHTVYNQPAGHLEAGETLLQAAARETWEETAWRFHPTALLGIYQWTGHDNGVTYLRFCFSGECGEHDPRQPLDDGIIRACWLTHDEVLACRDRHRSPLVLRCIDDFRAGRRFPLSLYTDLTVA